MTNEEQAPSISQNQKAADWFGETLMQQLRDTQIRFWDQFLIGQTKHSNYREIYDGLRQSLDEEQIASFRDLMPYIVDDVIVHLLAMLETKREIKVTVSLDGNTVPDIRKATDGLDIALYTEDGWIARFSKERYDPFGLEKGC